MVYGLLFLVFYFYISLLKLVPRCLTSLSIFVFLSTIYLSILYNLFFEFSSFDLMNQNIIVIYIFLFEILIYNFKCKIKSLINEDLIRYLVQIMTTILMHLCLYEEKMSDISSFLYAFSFTLILWELYFQYV